MTGKKGKIVPISTPEEARQSLLAALENHLKTKKERNDFLSKRIEDLISRLDDDDFRVSPQEDANLLEEMISLGLFPSFSFPLDVANFEALGSKKSKGEEKVKKWVYASTSQDLKVALSIYAPGRQLTINKQTFKVEGIGVNFPENPVHHVRDKGYANPHFEFEGEKKVLLEDAKEWTFFHRCQAEHCNVIFKSTSPSFNLNGEAECPICSCMDDGSKGDVVSSRMIRPEVFRPLIVPYRDGYHHKKKTEWGNTFWCEMRAPEETDESRSIVGRASWPTPLASSDMDKEGFKLIWPEPDKKSDAWKTLEVWHLKDNDDVGQGTKLLVVNEGPNQKGFKICPDCGHVNLTKKDLDEHWRPYAITEKLVQYYVSNVLGLDSSTDEYKTKVKSLMSEAKGCCSGTHSEPHVLGFTFRTDIIAFRFPIREPMTTEWNTPPFESAVRAIKEALITEATAALKLVNREIGGNFRKVAAPREKNPHIKDQYIDIFLYDEVSGGAGLVTRIGDPNDPETSVENILERVYKRLGGHSCLGGNPCGRVCTGCLLDYRNQQESDRMSRPLGLQMLENIRSGAAPNLEMVSTVNPPSDAVKNELITILRDIFSDSGIKISDAVDEGIISVEKKGVKRKIRPHSILMGLSKLKGDLLLWDATASNEDRLDNEDVVEMPFEILRDAPYLLQKVLYPVVEPSQEDDYDPDGDM